MTPADSPRSGLVVVLCRYIANHPDAKDTLEGICQWWIPERSERSHEVEAVLNSLVERMWMQTFRAVGVNMYGLNPPALPEIRRFLATPAGEDC